MKTRNIGIAAAVAVAVGGLWFGRLAWRAHHHLITLHVRNVPLAEVVRSLEHQTWEKIEYDHHINAKITLNVKDALLDNVLDLVAERAGARWQRTYAVGANKHLLSKLESVLSGNENLENAGWTNVAPPALDVPREGVIEGGPGPNQVLVPPGGGGPVTINPGNGGPPPDGARIFRRLLRPGGPPGGGGSGSEPGMGGGGMAGPGGGQAITILPDGATDFWSSKRIVLERDLLPQLGSNAPAEATKESAQQLASTVHGHSLLYYNIASAPFGMGGPGPGFGRRMIGGSPEGGARKKGPGQLSGPGDIVSMITKAQQQQRLSEMSRSPEEQVERARQNAPNKMRIATSDEDSKPN
ncbi:MAG TPA: hypothetical protein VGO67_13770 [Verrucomicrobiae bacterium]|jgi:hypothetical protein